MMLLIWEGGKLLSCIDGLWGGSELVSTQGISHP